MLYEWGSVISDMEEECFPAISLNTASGRDELSSSSSSSSTSAIILKRSNDLVPEDVECAEIKGEPLSAPTSPSESCQTAIVDDKTTITMVFPQTLHFSKNHLSQTSDSEEDDEEYYQVAYCLFASIASLRRPPMLSKIKVS